MVIREEDRGGDEGMKRGKLKEDGWALVRV